MGTVRKLVVEVVEARDLLPKDGAGSSSPYAVLDFDGQRKRTQTVHRSLNPTWNEVLKFDVSNSNPKEPLEVEVLHDRRVTPSRRSNFLGRLRLDSAHFVSQGEEALIHYPLQKKSFFGWVRGHLALKIYFCDEPLPPPPPAPDAGENEEPAAAEAQKPAADTAPPAETALADAEKAAGAAGPPAQGQAMPAEAPPTQDQAMPAEAPPPQDQAMAGEAPPAAEQPASDPPSEEAADGSQEPPPVAPAEAEAPPPAEDTTPLSGPDAHSVIGEPDGAQPPPPQDPEKAAATPQPQPKPVARSPASTAAADAVERSSLDLVEKMEYLFVRVVRARSLPTGAANPRVRVAVSGRHVSTGPAAPRRAHQRAIVSFDWDQTFAFPRVSSRDADAPDPAPLEVSVWDHPSDEDPAAAGNGGCFIGGVCFDVSEMPTRDPPDSPLAPQWYRLEGDDGAAATGDLMLATWVGTQADESFHGAWKADAPSGGAAARSKVYLSPKLWYLRLTVLNSQDLLPLPLAATATAAGMPLLNAPVSVRATLGFQSLRTRPASLHRGGSLAPPSWNEDLLFVAAEPFGDQPLQLVVELRPGKEPPAMLGIACIPLSSVERRVDDRKVSPRWLDLVVPSAGKKQPAATGTSPRLRGRLQVRVCLDGGYHVADEPSHACSDYRPSARQLWQPPVGTLELGIIGCRNLLPTKTIAAAPDGGLLRATADAYAVAKYGPKWARTRTIADSLDPTWNEQYTWPVHDPCTVLTVAVFDESSPDGARKDTSAACRAIGRVRIRVSALESGRPYRASYPLYLLLPTGLRRAGEVDLAVRFARAGSALDLLHVYGQPVLSIMHYLRPIAASQSDQLRLAAVRVLAAHLARSEPSLRKEAVMYVLEAEPLAQTGFSMRKARANWNRVVSSLTWAADVARWTDSLRSWRNPTATMLAHVVLVLLVWHPDLIVPAVGLHVSLLGVWKYRKRPRGTAGTGHVDLRASQFEVVAAPAAAQLAEELDEEFDPAPSGRGAEVVRARYDRLRAAAARVQGALGDAAAQGERLQGLVTWRDPRATGIFVAACLVISIILLVVPAKAVAVAAGFYWLRHPVFRNRAPPRAVNFFRRLPTLSDRIM